VELIELEYNNVSEWILERRKEDLLNLVENYYFGMSLYITSERKNTSISTINAPLGKSASLSSSGRDALRFF